MVKPSIFDMVKPSIFDMPSIFLTDKNNNFEFMVVEPGLTIKVCFCFQMIWSPTVILSDRLSKKGFFDATINPPIETTLWISSLQRKPRVEQQLNRESSAMKGYAWCIQSWFSVHGICQRLRLLRRQADGLYWDKTGYSGVKNLW